MAGLPSLAGTHRPIRTQGIAVSIAAQKLGTECQGAQRTAPLAEDGGHCVESPFAWNVTFDTAS